MTRWIVTASFLLLFLAAASETRADDSIYIGPDIGKDAPVVIDTIGEKETIFRAWASPSSKSKPSKWSAKLSFFVHYSSIDSDDVVQIQVMKGRKKIGMPTPCNPRHVNKTAQLGWFDCQAPKGRDYPTMFKTKGEHTLKLTYKKPVEGKTFKDFATMRVIPLQLKQGAANNPYVGWAEDHDLKLTVSTIEEKVSNGGHSMGGAIDRSRDAALGKKGIPYMMVHTWFKREKRAGRTKITCLHNGKRVAEAKATSNHRFNYWGYLKKGSQKRDEAKWEQEEYFLYSLHPRPQADGSKGSWSKPQHWMNENPGEYRCVITGDGDIVKELYFTVGKDGEIVKPACQLASMNSMKTVTLLRSKDLKLSDRKYDKKRGKKLGYEGRVRWSKGCPPVQK